MAAAVLIDGTDGALARWARVKAVLPAFDGGKMDDLVDYLNYVVVPTVLFYQWGFFPEGLGIAVSAFPLMASVYGFCHAEAKTSDHFFRGFPSYWNILAFYLFALSTPPWLNAWAVIILSALVFAPVYFVYPSRTPTLRPLTWLLGGLWAVMILGLIWQLPHPSRVLLAASLFFPLYYLVLSLVLQGRRLHRRAG